MKKCESESDLPPRRHLREKMERGGGAGSSSRRPACRRFVMVGCIAVPIVTLLSVSRDPALRGARLFLLLLLGVFFFKSFFKHGDYSTWYCLQPGRCWFLNLRIK